MKRGRKKGRGRPKGGVRPGKSARAGGRAAASPGDRPAKRLVGELRLHRDGYGFVVPASGGEDAFIPARFVGDALHTDVVEVTIVKGRGGKLEGRISRIVERGVDKLVGRLSLHDGKFEVVVDDRRVRHRMIVSPGDLHGAGKGDNVVVAITVYPLRGEPMVGRVVKVLGARGDLATETEAVIVRHRLTRPFPGGAVAEAEVAAGFDLGSEIASREDLRDIPFVTIDGETAKDFDDAVAARREGDLIKFWVSIADVSHFVKPGTALDAAAFERGTSVYFPGDCIPMLPEALSNDACSLRPNEPRLTFTAEMTIDAGGDVAESRFYRSVIKSRVRLTYKQVKRTLVDNDRAVIAELGETAGHLKLMRQCFERLRKRRIARGSIDFDLPEPEILIDMRGDVEDIVRSERHVGHMMIEEFMIAANEAVARFLTEARAGCIYRVHEQPPEEKLSEFAVLVHNLGYDARITSDASPGKLAKVVGWAHGKPFERMVNHMLLRSMSQAVYSPENAGHYGLASRCYCHFTSPIRRYPDLVVHRLLANALVMGDELGRMRRRGRSGKAARTGLDEISEHCSRRERIAMEAEREMAKLYAALFMEGRVGQEFEGIISHVAKFGFFVELKDYFVEGLVHVTELTDDHYLFDEVARAFVGKRRKRSFRVGDSARISVLEVDIPNREIIFELV